LYRFPRRQAGQSWGGQDLNLSASLSFSEEAELSLNSRWVQEEEPDAYNKVSRWRTSGKHTVTPAAGWWLKSQFQLCRSPAFAQSGRMLSLAVKRRWRLRSDYTLSAEFRSGVYSAEDYAVRLYWIEYDISGILRARPIWGKGSVAQVSFSGGREKWGRISTVWLWNQPAWTGSGSAPFRTITIVFKYP